MHRYVRLGLLVGLVGLLFASSGETSASPGTITLVSVNTAGEQGNRDSFEPSISGDGLYVAFTSVASNMLSCKENEAYDVFLRDRGTSITRRASVDSSGCPGLGGGVEPAMSEDGRYVAFSSGSDLVPNDTNGKDDVFVHDRQTGITERVSLSSEGGQGDDISHEPAINEDGRFVAFWSASSNLVHDDTNGVRDVFVHDQETGVTERVSVDSLGNQGNGFSTSPAISADGRYVAFESQSSNLVADDSNGVDDVFVHDRQTGLTDRVSVDSAGSQGDSYSNRPAISADGRYVSFESLASNLVIGDTNGKVDIFVHDQETGVTERVNLDDEGNQMNGQSWYSAISGDGRYVAFSSIAGVSASCFLRDREDDVTELVAGGSNGSCEGVDVSSDGRYVAFGSRASDLVPRDLNGVKDVFLLDRGPGSVGGIAELPSVLDSSGPNHLALVGSVAAVLVALTGGALYARRRWVR